MTGASRPAWPHRFVPPGHSASRRTLLLLHGTGGNEDDLLPVGARLAPGAALLSPRGPVLEGEMPRFFRRLAEGVFDLDDLRVRTAELADFVREASASYGLDPAGIVAVGLSNGANIAGSLLLLSPGALSAAVLIRPMVPLIPERAPDLRGVPVLLLSGRDDPVVPPGQPEELARMLGAAGATVTLDWQEAGHQLLPGDVHAATRWFAQLPPLAAAD